MMELEIGGVVYAFRFGMGFLREINRRVTLPLEGAKGVAQNVGLRYAIAQVMDGDVETLADVLDVANRTEQPRLARKDLEAWLEDEGTDIEAVFTEVLDFFSRANCTRKTAKEVLEAAALLRQKAQA